MKLRYYRSFPSQLVLPLAFGLVAGAIAVPALLGSAGPVRNDSLDAQIAALQRDVDQAQNTVGREAAQRKLDVVLAERAALLDALKQPPASGQQDANKAAQLSDFIATADADAPPYYIVKAATLTGVIIETVPPGGEFRARTAWLGPVDRGSRIRVYAGQLESGAPALRIYREGPVGSFPLQFEAEVLLPAEGMADVVGEAPVGVLDIEFSGGGRARFDTVSGKLVD